MKIAELRSVFLDFFKGQGHTIVRSDSLVPQNDPSLLFTPAGMNQFKDYFLGRGKIPYRRAASCQKCLRTGDIEIVGTTAKHQTFFEMLGNFSFGDYFKKEAIAWAWEFLTKTLKIPDSKLYVSIYTDDDEAFKIWRDDIKVPEQKIFRFGEKDNFWPSNARTQGPNGPCGPCSEIYYDYGPGVGCSKPACTVGCDCDRYVEVWNLVFTQFERLEGGILVPLSQKNIDTGMGLERIAAVMQNVTSNFETDIFKLIIEQIHTFLKIEPVTKDNVRIKRIADHIRAITFLISDGVIPSNEERGYVVRRLLRMAVKDGYMMGLRNPWLFKLSSIVVNTMSEAYPELKERQENVTRIIKAEEEKFLSTIDQGTLKIDEFVDRLLSKGIDTLSGEEAFTLYDTHGFPVELIESFLAEKGLRVDKNRYKTLLEESRERSRKEARFKDIFAKGPVAEIKQKCEPTKFVGYTKTKSEAKIIALVKGEQLVQNLETGETGIILLDTTPFYGEQGGQIGDTGTLATDSAQIQITDTKRNDDYFLHHAKVTKGALKVGDQVIAEIDQTRRLNIMRNHTGTHLLQAALRHVLGTHVQQTGSIVEPNRLRFDFTHFQPMTDEEIRKVEMVINEKIMNEITVEKIETSFDEAKKMGALMFFGDKYGDRVRVIQVSDFSIEFCGGTHLDRTSTIGFFKITQETSIGSGMRRIEAVTGPEAIRLALEDSETLSSIALQFRAIKKDIPKKIEQLVQQNKNLSSQLDRFKKELSQDSVGQILNSATVINGDKVISFKAENRSVDEARSLIDVLIKKHQVACALVTSTHEEKTFCIVGVRQDMVAKGLKAGEIAKRISAKLGTSGGGKDHMAQFGGSESQIETAFDEFKRMITEILQRE